MGRPNTEYRSDRRARLARLRELAEGRPPRNGATAPDATAGAGGVPVQLELGCRPDVLLSRAAARAHFGGSGLEDTWADFIEDFFPGEATFVTFTYSDEGGKRYLAYRPPAVFGDVQRFLSRRGYDGPALFVCERHQWRDILHAHGLIHGMTARDRVALQEAWYADRGRARLLPATAGAFPYVCKYALKHSDAHGDFMDLRHLPTFQAVKVR